MKYLFVHLFLITVFLALSDSVNANNPGKDFLITLDGSKLTGSIKDISQKNGEYQISFENDFGNIYILEPATIYGFSYEKNGETSMFESKNLDGKWRFLKVEKKGEKISLFTSSERQLKFMGTSFEPVLVEEKNPQFWIQFKNEQPIKVYKLNYKRYLRRHIADFEALKKRIGKKGFRYANLPNMIDLYNRFHDNNT